VLNEPVAIPLTGSNPLGASSPTPTVPEFSPQSLAVALLVGIIIVLSLVIIAMKKAGKSKSTKISTET
jgi:hypothetical protein